MSFKNRITYLEYYWENLKVDMTKALLADKSNPEKSKALSLGIFSIAKDVKHSQLQKYAEYARQVFIFKYYQWRKDRLAFQKITSTFDWILEIISTRDKVRSLEQLLFEGVDSFILELFDKIDQKSKLKTTLTLKGIKWDKDYTLVKIDSIPDC